MTARRKEVRLLLLLLAEKIVEVELPPMLLLLLLLLPKLVVVEAVVEEGAEGEPKLAAFRSKALVGLSSPPVVASLGEEEVDQNSTLLRWLPELLVSVLL